MEQKKERFYLTFVVLMVVIISLIIYVNPLKQIKNRGMDEETSKTVSVLNLKRRIDEYHIKHKEYPKSLDSYRKLYDFDLDSLVEYECSWDDYVLKTRFSISGEKLVLTKSKIEREKNEE